MGGSCQGEGLKQPSAGHVWDARPSRVIEVLTMLEEVFCSGLPFSRSPHDRFCKCLHETSDNDLHISVVYMFCMCMVRAEPSTRPILRGLNQ